MAEQVKKPIKITETILRDAHQSLIATRMTTEQMLPIVEKLDKVGYHSVECWGLLLKASVTRYPSIHFFRLTVDRQQQTRHIHSNRHTS